jgi:protein-tyrosine phosphatase
MHEIYPNLLWLGNAQDAREPRPLFEAGIRAVVDVALDELPARLPRELVYCRFPLEDGSGNDSTILRLAIQCLIDLLALGTRSLVACSAGMSRSPTIAAYALAAYLNDSPDSVIAQIANIRSLEIHPQLWNDAASIMSQIRQPE